MRMCAFVVVSLFVLVACGGNVSDVYSGTLQAPSAAVGSTIGGRIASVLVSEGDAVRKGQVLVLFDDRVQQAALAAALARYAQARASLADVRAGARPEELARARDIANQGGAQYEIARSQLAYQTAVLREQLRQALARESSAAATWHENSLNSARMHSLYSTGDVSAQQRDAAVAQSDRSAAQLADARAAVRSAQEQLASANDVTLPLSAASAQYAYRAQLAQYRLLAAGPRADQIRESEAAVRAARGEVASARAQIAEGTVRSPADGVVTAMDLHAGDLIAPGVPVATIDERGNPYVRIYVPQSKLGRVKVGATLAIRSDALPGVSFDGVVENVDARAQFTPQSVQTASDRALLTFGVKVRVRDPQHRLHGGTTVEASLP